MQQWVEGHGVHHEHSHDTPTIVWKDYVKHFRKQCGDNLVGKTRRQVLDLVYRNRNNILGGDIISKVKSQYYGPKNRAFLCHSSISTDVDCMQRMVCFRKPELMDLLSYPNIRILLFSPYYIPTNQTAISLYSLLSSPLNFVFLASNVC